MMSTPLSCATKSSPPWRSSRTAHTRCDLRPRLPRILARLGSSGRLVALDRDPDAERSAQAIVDPRFTFRRCWFSELPDALEALGVVRVDGFLFDLGISSPQIDDPGRGFSFRADGPLDMRMDPTRGESAAAFLARATARNPEVTATIVKNGLSIDCKAIVAARTLAEVQRTRQLAAIVAKAVGTRPRSDRSQDPATRTFQALRIFVNRGSRSSPSTARRPMDADRREDRRDQLPFAGGSHRQALLRRCVATLRRRPAAGKAADPHRCAPGAPPGRSVARSASSARLRKSARGARRCVSPSGRRTRCQTSAPPSAAEPAMVRLNLLLLAVLVVCALSLVVATGAQALRGARPRANESARIRDRIRPAAAGAVDVVDAGTR